MKRLRSFTLFSAFLAMVSIKSAFAGPFGIDMGMSLVEVRLVSKTPLKFIEDDVYELTPPKTNNMFETYYVRIDPEYGVYWLKAIGKDIYTNSYGDEVRSKFEKLVGSISKTYGEEYSRTDKVKEESMEYMKNSENFMISLERGIRTLQVSWVNDSLVNRVAALGASMRCIRDLLDNPEYKDDALKIVSDSTALSNFIEREMIAYQERCKEKFGDISFIVLYATAQSSSVGSIWLEYSFSNADAVEANADSVF